MKLRRAPAINPMLMFLVPAIQIPLLLLLFVFLGASFLLQPGISISVPDSPFVLSPRREPRVITIPAPPSSAIFFDDRQTDLVGLRGSLEPLRGHSQTIVIRADKLAVYNRVVEVLNVALGMGFQVVLATAEENE